MKTEKTSINNPHDKFFKSVFTKKAAVAEFIEKLMPAELAKHLDLDSLTLDNNDYIDEKLQQHCSDVVYQCDYLFDNFAQKSQTENTQDALNKNRQRTTIKIALLFEHKSYPEPHPHLQLMRYLLSIWELQIKQKQPLTPIIPIIFYHGKPKWQYQSLPDYFSQIDTNLATFLPMFDYLLLDTSHHDNEYFKQLHQAELQYGILAMKHIFNMAQFFEDITEIFADIDQFISTQAGRKFFKTMILYLYQYTDLTFEEWEDKMQTVSAQAKKQFVSTYDQAIAMGMQRGIQQGIEKGIQQGIKKGVQQGIQQGMEKGIQQGILNTAKNFKEMGLDLQSIAQATGLSVNVIDKL